MTTTEPNPNAAAQDTSKLGHHAIPSYLDPNQSGPYAIYLEQVERVTPYLGKLAYWVETLKRPKRILVVDVPIHLDDGTVAHFEGYRVQHNTSRGPAKGGVRYHQDVTLSEVMAPERVDDREECRREPAVRRRQGRHPHRSAQVQHGRTRAPDAPLHHRNRPRHRARKRHPRPRREHQPADDGVDDGHLFDERGPHRDGRGHG